MNLKKKKEHNIWILFKNSRKVLKVTCDLGVHLEW